MLRTMVSLVGICIVSRYGYAQHSYGLQAEILMSRQLVKFDDATWYGGDLGLGYGLSGIYSRVIHPRLYCDASLRFARYAPGDPFLESNTFDLYYLEPQLSLSRNVFRNLDIELGLSGAYLLYSGIQSSGASIQQETFQQWNIGAASGLRYALNERLFIGLEFSLSILNETRLPLLFFRRINAAAGLGYRFKRRLQTASSARQFP